MNRFFLLFLFFGFSTLINSQTVKSREQYFILNSSQIRESMNYGFVFSGPQLQYGRNWQWNRKSVLYGLESQLGIAVLSKKGSCFDFHLSPVNIDCLMNINDQIWLGPCLISDYNYEFYPDLQAGHDFWFSHYSAGISFIFRKTFHNRLLSVKFKSALVGVTSRTPDDFDALFFDIGFKYAMKDLHKNMQYTSVNRYRVFRFEAAFIPLNAQRINLSCLIDYMQYQSIPAWTRLNYGIKLTIHPKNSNS